MTSGTSGGPYGVRRGLAPAGAGDGPGRAPRRLHRPRRDRPRRRLGRLPGPRGRPWAATSRSRCSASTRPATGPLGALRPRDRDHRPARPPAPQHRHRARHRHHRRRAARRSSWTSSRAAPSTTGSSAFGPLPAEEVGRIGAVLADALSFAHERGVLHRDVKPQNVLVLPTSWVLADFGIARLVDSEHTSSAETFTYRHAAPQILDGHAADRGRRPVVAGLDPLHAARRAPAVRQRRPRRGLRAGLPAPRPHRAAPPARGARRRARSPRSSTAA